MKRTEEAPASPAPAVAADFFGMAQALVIVAFLAAAVVLSLCAHMPVRDVLLLLGAAGAIGVAVVVAANAKSGTGKQEKLIRRLVAAALNNGSGS